LGEFTRKQASLENNITIYVQLLSYVYSVGKILSMSFQELLSSHTVFKQNFMRRLYVPVYARLLQKLSLNQIKLMTKKRIISFHIHFTLHQWIFTVWRTTQKSWLLTVGGRGERGTAIARVWRWAMKMVVAS